MRTSLYATILDVKKQTHEIVSNLMRSKSAELSFRITQDNNEFRWKMRYTFDDSGRLRELWKLGDDSQEEWRENDDHESCNTSVWNDIYDYAVCFISSESSSGYEVVRDYAD